MGRGPPAAGAGPDGGGGPVGHSPALPANKRANVKGFPSSSPSGDVALLWLKNTGSSSVELIMHTWDGLSS